MMLKTGVHNIIVKKKDKTAEANMYWVLKSLSDDNTVNHHYKEFLENNRYKQYTTQGENT